MITKGIRSRLNCYFATTSRHSYYQILQISPTASPEQIKASYYKLAKQYHPDKNSSYAERFKVITEAYNTLKDPTKRNKYDQQIKYTFRTGSSAGSNHSNQSSRNFHYGYQYRGDQNMRDGRPKYENPYANYASKSYSFNSQNSDFENFQNDKRKQQFEDYLNRKANQMGMQRGTMKSPNDLNQQIRKAFIVGFGILSVVLVAQIIIRVYQFNALARRRSYYQRLDPRQI